mgnify:CR=1 FL=1
MPRTLVVLCAFFILFWPDISTAQAQDDAARDGLISSDTETGLTLTRNANKPRSGFLRVRSRSTVK